MGKRNAYALAAQQRKAGAHSEAKRPERDVYDDINEYTDEQCEELKARWPNRDEIYDVGEHVEIVRGTWQYDQGRIVMRRQDKGDYSYGVVFDWDVRMHVTYFTGKDFKRVQQ